MKKITLLLCATIYCSSVFTQPGTIKNSIKLSSLSNKFNGLLDEGDYFGSSVAYLNDIDGDGIGDIAITAYQDDDGGLDKGAIWIVFLNEDGSIKSYAKISDTQGSFDAILDEEDHLGAEMDAIGDINNDGICDIAVGAGADDDGGVDKGAIYIIFLNTDGSAKSHQKISVSSGGFNTSLNDRAGLGNGITLIGDLDKDGVNEIAISAPRDLVDNVSKGAIWILFLHPDGTIKKKTYITEGEGGFNELLDKDGFFGNGIERIGDLNKDGIEDIIVSASHEDVVGIYNGALYIIFLNSDGTVKSTKKLSKLSGLSSVIFSDYDFLGQSMAFLNDIDGDGYGDIAVGMPSGNTNEKGKVLILFLHSDGSVKSIQEISDISGNFYGNIGSGDQFAWSLSPLYDFNGDGIMDLIVGSKKDDDGGLDRGAIWLLYLEGVKNSRKEIDLKTEIEVFPMPFYDDIHIYLPSKKTHPIMYQIYNMVGCEVGKGHLSNIVSEITLDLSYLHSGVYFMKIEQEYSSSVFKIIKSE